MDNQVRQNNTEPQGAGNAGAGLLGIGGQGAATPGGPPSDVDAAVNEAVESSAFEEMGMGVEMASEEEHQTLKQILDSIELAIHGNGSDRIVNLIDSADEPFEGIAMAAHALTLASYMQANKEGIPVDEGMYLAENGAVEQTVEMLWEVADAMGKVDADDDAQLSAAYLNTMQRIGETLLEEDDTRAVKSAQELLIEMETGEEVSGEAVFEEERQMAQAGAQGQGGPPMPPNAPQAPGGPQAAPQGPMPPMPMPNQGQGI